MYNIYDDWPKDMESFNTWIEESYDSISYATSNVKYYYDSKGNIIDYTTWQTLAASQRNDESIYQYELRKNINKSKIKIVSSQYITNLDTALKSILSKPIL